MKTLLTFGLGALTMYLLDPEQGRRRRALLRDQWTHAQRVLRERTAGATRDLSHRVNTQLERDRATEMPEGARHLGR